MQLEMAAHGWLGETWDDAYPDDLPPEWRLDYYSNQFDAVCVPAIDWRNEKKSVLEQWLEEAHGGVHLYWELSDEGEAQRLLQLYRSAGVSPAGWAMLPGRVLAVSIAQELRALAPLLESCGHGEWRDGDSAMLEVEAEPDLRRLREAIDRSAEEGVRRLVLRVSASPQAAQTLQQIQTLCQLYGG